jgi:hypothetical protein
MKPRRCKSMVLFHITTAPNWGPVKLLKPRSRGPFRGEDEPRIARTCFAPSPGHCLSAILGSLDTYRPIHIYSTFGPVESYYTYDVCDSHITREKWILEPVQVRRVGRIERQHLDDFMALHCKLVPWDYLSSDGSKYQKIALKSYLAYSKKFLEPQYNYETLSKNRAA